MFCGKIYKISNKTDGKFYIGQTTTKNPLKRWKEHITIANHPLYRAMVFDGIKNFRFEILENGIRSYRILNNIEKNYICEQKTFDSSFGYNISTGTIGTIDKQINGFVYRIVNLQNNKQYIGKTVNPNYERWKQHCYYAKHPLYRAMIMEKVDNFRFEVIHDNIPTKTVLNKLESQLIVNNKTFKAQFGYNKDFGLSSYLVKKCNKNGLKAQS